MKKQIILILLMYTFILSTQAKNNTKEQEKDTKKTSSFRIGGYGEMLWQHLDYSNNRFSGTKGTVSDKRMEISIPRFILAFQYKFTPSWELNTEIEFEYGGTGSALEFETAGEHEVEYEFEKAGEVVLEQFHITKIFSKAANLRFGHQIVPVGYTNAFHEPIFYFGTTRPEGESTLIPCTWHETGVSFFGSAGDFTYEAMVVNGLDPTGFSSQNWIQGGVQTKFETTHFNNPAFVARLEYMGIKGLRIGASGYYAAKTQNNVSDQNDVNQYDFDGTVAIGSLDAQYKDHGLIVRANVLYGYIGDASTINQMSRVANSLIGFTRTPVMSNALTYFAEAGYNVGQHIKKDLNLYPFMRYEYNNSMQNELTGLTTVPDGRCKTELIVAGINYFPVPNIVFKVDYKHRMVGRNNDLYTFNNENTIAVAVAFTGWFFKQ